MVYSTHPTLMMMCSDRACVATDWGSPGNYQTSCCIGWPSSPAQPSSRFYPMPSHTILKPVYNKNNTFVYPLSIKYVTGPVKTNNKSSNYTELQFRYYFQFLKRNPASTTCRRKPIKFFISGKYFVA